jgi:hypothetical protein
MSLTSRVVTAIMRVAPRASFQTICAGTASRWRSAPAPLRSRMAPLQQPKPLFHRVLTSEGRPFCVPPNQGTRPRKRKRPGTSANERKSHPLLEILGAVESRGESATWLQSIQRAALLYTGYRAHPGPRRRLQRGG